jgi:hypothetical protein
MTRSLNVLIIESRRGAADAETRALEAAGHRTTRCFDEANAVGFPCRAVVDPADCPLLDPPDVALVVRRHIATHPRPLEQGASCALRAGIPVVEAGPELLDPYGPWLTARLDADVVAGCEAAADSALAELRGRIMRLVDPTFAAAGVARDDVTCTIDTSGPDLNVHFAVPVPVTTGVRQALAVRVLDAVRGARHTYGKVGVSVGVSP